MSDLDNQYLSTKINKYLYYLNYPDNLKNLCDLEMKSIFGFIPETKSFITSNYISPSRSIFIKGCLTISYEEERLEDLCTTINADELHYNDYKIFYIKSSDEVKYRDRLNALRLTGFCIEGSFNLQNPKIEFGLSKVNQKWLFGQYIKNNHSYLKRKQKPFNYSYALDHIFAKSLINIAIGNDYNLKVVDPCCGVGTVIIEGRELGIDIKGFDINPNIVYKCNKNLRFFGFNADVESKDIQDVTEIYDVAIVDLPYGKFSKTSLNEQKIIINKTKKIARKAIFVSMVEMNSLLNSCGFKIQENCFVPKTDNFSRYITICG